MKITLLVFLLALGYVPHSFSQEPMDISMVKLLAAPQQFDGKLIRVDGFLNIEFENIELYLHEQDSVHGLAKNGLWLDLDRQARKKYGHLNHQYVFVEGTVDAKHFGHMGATSATIVKIQRIDRLH